LDQCRPILGELTGAAISAGFSAELARAKAIRVQATRNTSKVLIVVLNKKLSRLIIGLEVFIELRVDKYT
jgi:hypothetical protein